MAGTKSYRKAGSKYGQLYYSRNATLTIQLERIQSAYDGTSQLIDAIRRLLEQWDDVWALSGCSFKVSQSRSFNDFEAEDAQREQDARAKASAYKIITAAS